MCLGFGTASKAVGVDEFRALGATVNVCTDDGTLGTHGFCTDPAAALLGGPAEAAVTGLTVGICYDLSFTGVDGLYPLFFLLFGYAAGKLCLRLLTRNYISMLFLTAFECVLLGLLR